MRVMILGVFATAELTVVGSTRPMTISTVDIINDEGVIQSISGLVKISSDTYASMFMMPLVGFKMQVRKWSGYQFSYVSDSNSRANTSELNFW